MSLASQSSMFEVGEQQFLALSLPVERTSHVGCELAEIVGRGVYQVDAPAAIPNLLDRVEFRRVCRQPLDPQPPRLLGQQQARRLEMRAATIPVERDRRDSSRQTAGESSRRPADRVTGRCQSPPRAGGEEECIRVAVSGGLSVAAFGGGEARRRQLRRLLSSTPPSSVSPTTNPRPQVRPPRWGTRLAIAYPPPGDDGLPTPPRCLSVLWNSARIVPDRVHRDLSPPRAPPSILECVRVTPCFTHHLGYSFSSSDLAQLP